MSVPLTGGIYRIPKGTEVERTIGTWAVKNRADAIKAGVPELDAGRSLWIPDSAVDE